MESWAWIIIALLSSAFVGLIYRMFFSPRLKKRDARGRSRLGRKPGRADARSSSSPPGPMSTRPAEVGAASLAGSLADRDQAVRLRALESLAALGPAAAPAIPALGEAIVREPPRLRRAAALALSKIGEPAAPFLAEMLGDNRPAVREAAASALGLMGGAARSAVDALARALSDDSPRVREAAGLALAGLGPQAAQALPALTAALKDPEQGVRAAAIKALAAIGPAAKEAAGALLDLMACGSALERESAAEALGRIGTSAAPLLIPAVSSADERMKDHLVMALSRMGAPVAPFLIEALKGPEKKVRAVAVEALAGLGPEALPALELLTALVADEDRELSSAAALALGRIGPNAAPAVPALMGLLRSGDPFGRKAAGEALAGFGPETLPFLREALADLDANVRYQAAKVLGRLGPGAIGGLIGDFLSAERGGRARLEEALLNLGEPAFPFIIEAAKNSRAGERFLLVSLLGRSRPPPEAAGFLVESLADADFGVRAAAARALGRMGEEVVNALVKRGGESDAQVRCFVIEALAFIGREARVAAPFLESCLADPEEAVREAAAKALKIISNAESET